MPDWSYRTVLQPFLLVLPAAAARELSLGVVGGLGRFAPGRVLIDFLGHMRAPAGIGVTRLGLAFPSRAGLGCGLDPGMRATGAFARFGCGFVEVGPILVEGRDGGGLACDPAAGCLRLADPPDGPGLDEAAGRLAGVRTAGVPVLARLDLTDQETSGAVAAEAARAMGVLGLEVGGFTIACGRSTWTADDWRNVAGVLTGAAHAARRPALLVLPADLGVADRDRRIDSAATGDGFVVEGAVRTANGCRLVGAPARAAALETVRAIRARAGAGPTVIAGGGIHAPQDALDVLAAGADLVAIDSGLVFGGPGLPKRVNEVLEAAAGVRPAAAAATPDRAPEMSWFWTLLMGAGMLGGAVLALAIAVTRVVLPYDEHFVGLTRADLAAVNDRLLPFLTHDRVALAGTMVAIGVLYTSLSWFGVRRGRHWAHVAIVASAAAGFLSFFLFLGFGYFDPFHAFVTAVLLQLLLLGVHGRLGPPRAMPPPMLVEDAAWRLGLWGQLGLVVQGVGFIGAGLVISTIGATDVFVREDLEFLLTTTKALAAASDRLLPLVAHDRATLGGMLLATGLVLLLTSLWGFRAGERWLWWTLLAAGIPGYAAAIGIHYVVGYHSTFHLTPAFLGLGIFGAALAAAYPTLCRRG